MIVKLLNEHHLEFLSLKGGCRGSSESTLVKLLEISCRGSYLISLAVAFTCEKIDSSVTSAADQLDKIVHARIQKVLSEGVRR